MFSAIVGVLRSAGVAVPRAVTLPVRLLARLFRGTSGTAHGRR
jgi:hypothetical protein